MVNAHDIILFFRTLPTHPDVSYTTSGKLIVLYLFNDFRFSDIGTIFKELKIAETFDHVFNGDDTVVVTISFITTSQRAKLIKAKVRYSTDFELFLHLMRKIGDCKRIEKIQISGEEDVSMQTSYRLASKEEMQSLVNQMVTTNKTIEMDSVLHDVTITPQKVATCFTTFFNDIDTFRILNNREFWIKIFYGFGTVDAEIADCIQIIHFNTNDDYRAKIFDSVQNLFQEDSYFIKCLIIYPYSML